MTRRFRNVGVRCWIGSPACWFPRLPEPAGQCWNLTLLFQEIRHIPFEAQVQIPQVQQAGNEGKGHGDYSNFEELPGCDLNVFTPQRNKRRERSAG